MRSEFRTVAKVSKGRMLKSHSQSASLISKGQNHLKADSLNQPYNRELEVVREQP